MSTNYFARILPTQERKKKLYDAISSNDFNLIKKLTDEMYGSIKKDWDSEGVIGGVVHLGKGSCGWKFLWNPNIFVIRHGHSEKIEVEPNHYRHNWIEEPSTALYTYPLTKKGLKAFIDREDVLIYDEYDELQDKEEFWKMALEWGQDKDWDAASYEKEHNNHIYPITGELTDLLKQEGYKFTSSSNSDFYSDGLRFAGFTEFS